MRSGFVFCACVFASISLGQVQQSTDTLDRLKSEIALLQDRAASAKSARERSYKDEQQRLQQLVQSLRARMQAADDHIREHTTSCDVVVAQRSGKTVGAEAMRRHLDALAEARRAKSAAESQLFAVEQKVGAPSFASAEEMQLGRDISNLKARIQGLQSKINLAITAAKTAPNLRLSINGGAELPATPSAELRTAAEPSSDRRALEEAKLLSADRGADRRALDDTKSLGSRELKSAEKDLANALMKAGETASKSPIEGGGTDRTATSTDKQLEKAKLDPVAFIAPVQMAIETARVLRSAEYLARVYDTAKTVLEHPRPDQYAYDDIAQYFQSRASEVTGRGVPASYTPSSSLKGGQTVVIRTPSNGVDRWQFDGAQWNLVLQTPPP